jgi:hypothetical protein
MSGEARATLQIRNWYTDFREVATARSWSKAMYRGLYILV